MSSLNGDKSRHQINRKRTVVRRAKIRQLVEAAKTQSSAKGDQAPAESRPATAKPR